MSDDLRRLGWLDDPELAGKCLGILADKAALYRTQGVYEEYTKAIFVEPLLRGLGRDTLDHEQVDRETQRGWIIGDIHLGGNHAQGAWKLAAAIEVKRLDAADFRPAYWQLRGDILEHLFSGPDTYNQEILFRLDGEQFVRAVVTNGASSIIWDFHPGIEGLEVPQFDPYVERPATGQHIAVMQV